MSSKANFRQRRYVLGSLAELKLAATQEKNASAIFDRIWQLITGFDYKFTRFHADSELSQFNARAGEEVTVSPAFHAMLGACRHYAGLTEGLFNPFILPALQSAGYKGSWPNIDRVEPALDMSSRKIANPNDIEINDSTARIPVDSALDFGGIGKGYLLDEIGTLLEEESCENYCISLGGDIICRGFINDKPWPIAISDARRDGTILGKVTNKSGDRLAIATSGLTRISPEGNNHLIDPRSGQPSKTDFLEVTAIALTGTAADIYAKVCLLEPAMARKFTDLFGLWALEPDGATGKVLLDSRGFFSR